MDTNDRILSLRGEVDEKTTGPIIEAILQINDYDYNNSVRDREPIRLHIQSNGGNVLDAYALMDIILCSTTPVYTYCDGYVESSALTIYLAGERRFAYKHSRFMIHNMASSLSDKTTRNIEDNLIYIKELEEYDMDFLISRTNMDHEYVKNCLDLHKELFFGSKLALQYGIVTDIL